MQKYSEFFETLHDEQGRVGSMLCHYSILRAMVFHDEFGNALPIARRQKFAVIWDDDHDERIIQPIEKLFCEGLLSSFVMFGEQKAVFYAMAAEQLAAPKFKARVSHLEKRIEAACHYIDIGDQWGAQLEWINAPGLMMNASDDKARLYAATIKMLWDLGDGEATQ
jgi:hypothetical protein